MAVNTIELPGDLRAVVDNFVLENPSREYGGLLFGTPLRFDTFLPVPNVSPEPRSKYEMPKNWRQYAECFANVVGCELVAQVHTYPTHSIPSGQDVKSGSYWFNNVRYMVLIAPNAEANKTTWWVLDKKFEVQETVNTDEELEAASLLFARRYGFADLGHVLMNDRGDLQARGRIPQVFVDSPDARTLYTTVLRTKEQIESKKQLQSLSGLSLQRVNAALSALWEAGLLEDTIRYNELFKPVNIFGRRFG